MNQAAMIDIAIKKQAQAAAKAESLLDQTCANLVLEIKKDFEVLADTSDLLLVAVMRDTLMGFAKQCAGQMLTKSFGAQLKRQPTEDEVTMAAESLMPMLLDGKNGYLDQIKSSLHSEMEQFSRRHERKQDEYWRKHLPHTSEPASASEIVAATKATTPTAPPTKSAQEIIDSQTKAQDAAKWIEALEKPDTGKPAKRSTKGRKGRKK